MEPKCEEMEGKTGKEELHSDEFNELGSLDPNIDQTLMRLSGTV